MAISGLPGTTRVLICEGDRRVATRLGRWLERAGIASDWAHNVRRARQWLARNHYDALTLDLILPDQDGISFIRELRHRGLDIPVLGVSIRPLTRRPGLPLSLGDTADWLDRAADQARVILAMKVAVRQAGDYHPRILYVEPDNYSASLVAGTLGGCTELTRARSVAEIRDAMTLSDFDIVLLNPDLPDDPDGTALAMVAAACPGLPVLLHTSYRMMDDTDDIRARGPAGTAAGLVAAIRSMAVQHPPALPAALRA